MGARPAILVVDDDEFVRDMLVRGLASRGHAAVGFASADEALAHLASRDADLMLTDLRMPGMDGLELLRRARAIDPDLQVIMMTGYASPETAVEAMKAGASDYIAKPDNLEEISLRVERALRERDLARENRSLREELRSGYRGARGARLIGVSPAMRRIFDTIAAVSRNRSNVFIQGETGTGKELVAKAIHYGGPRAGSPFIALNCGSVSKTLLESQLFGHVKGAFTGAIRDTPGFFVAASGGTLFLDEITEVDTEIQAKLLRAIQEREVTPVGGTRPVPVDARIIAATNRDAKKAVQEGILRQDLYYRLSVVVIEIPPLRERTEDIAALVDYFNEKLSSEYGLEKRTISEAAMKALMSHSWPGNARELENVIERAFALGKGPTIDLEDLPPEIVQARRDGSPPGRGPAGDPGPLRLDEAVRRTLERALDETRGNKTEAARVLGVERKRLYRLLRRYGLA